MKVSKSTSKRDGQSSWPSYALDKDTLVEGNEIPWSQGSGQMRQSADEIGTDAAFKSAITPSEVAFSASAPIIRAFIFLAVEKPSMRTSERRNAGVHSNYKHTKGLY